MTVEVHDQDLLDFAALQAVRIDGPRGRNRMALISLIQLSKTSDKTGSNWHLPRANLRNGRTSGFFCMPALSPLCSLDHAPRNQFGNSDWNNSKASS